MPTNMRVPLFASPVLLVLSVLFFPHPSTAAVFQLALTPSSRVIAGRVTVRVAFANHGDEAMQNLRPSIWFDGAWHEGPLVAESLGPGESGNYPLDLGPTPALPGAYTAVAAMRYSDRNGHPFTTLQTIPVYTAEPPESAPLTATLAPPAPRWPVRSARGQTAKLTLRRRGTLTLILESKSADPLQAACTLILPEELAGIQTDPMSLEIPPQGAAHHAFQIQNAWAVPGSNYRVFAIVDYVLDGQHASLIVPGNIELATRRQLSERTVQRLWLIPGTLGLLYLALQFFWKKRDVKSFVVTP